MNSVCEGAYYIDNIIYGYQVSCTHQTQYWLNWGGWIILSICIIWVFHYLLLGVTKNSKKSETNK